MAERISLTGWLDPALKYFADQAGIPVDQYSSQVGGEGIGVGFEFLADLFSKGWVNKLIQFITGGAATGYAIWGKNVDPRLRRELLALGTHEMLRFVELTPSEAIEFRRSIDDFVAAMKRNDIEGMKAAVLRSPSELQAMLGALGARVARPAVAPTPPVSASVKPPAPTVGKGKYSLS